MRDGFAHKLNKQKIPACNIMGVEVSAVNMKWLTAFTKKYIAKLSGDYMCVANVHTTVMAYENEEYRRVQNGGILTAPDGGPLSRLGRRRGFHRMKRTTGPSYMEEMLGQVRGVTPSGEERYKHFFFGSTPETLEKLKNVLAERYPNAEIVGMISPPFRSLTEEEDAAIIREINRVKPDFIWVGLGAPKQEYWMAAHQGKVTGFMVGVGAGFDFLAGNIKRAPEWMQEHDLEWLYRLIQEPRRLYKRYLITNSKFLWHAWIRGE